MVLFVKTNRWLIAYENMQQDGGAAFRERLSLRLLHEESGQPLASMRWRNIQRDNVSVARTLSILDVQDDEANECAVLLGDDNARSASLGKATHRAAGESEWLLEAYDVERVHRVQITRLIGTQPDVHLLHLPPKQS